MPEYILIAGEPVEIPMDVIKDGTAQAWHRAQLQEKKVPHVVFANGDPVELPKHIAGKSKKEVEAWTADEAERRVDPIAYAEKKAQAKAEAPSAAPATPTAPVDIPSSKE